MATAETPASNAGIEQSAPQPNNRKFSIPVGVLVAELVGTFMLTATIIATSGQPLYVFFAIAAIVAIVGGLSGAHLNPAITFGAWITRRITVLRALGYILAQFAGAMLAFVTLNALLGGAPGNVNPYTGQSTPAELFKAAPLVENKQWFAFFAEILGTSILAFAVARALHEKTDRFTGAFSVAGGLFIGLVIAGSTAVLNPAVAVAVQALKFETWPIAVYVLAPVIGAAIGFLIYKLVCNDVEKSNTEADAVATKAAM